MRIVAFAYRKWAVLLLNGVQKKTGIKIRIFSNPKDVTPKNIGGADAVLFYGWSWMVPSEIVSNKFCVCLHPSLLPKYRGGSPIQNQIIAGEKAGGVTLFRMDEGLDSGPILGQQKIPLEGDLDEVIERIRKAGEKLTVMLLERMSEGAISPKPQDHRKATIFRRRKPEQGRLLPEEMTARQMHDLVRALNGADYPPAFLLGRDGKKLLILKARVE